MRIHNFSFFLPAAMAVVLFLSFSPQMAAYDPLDPSGNITIVWDVMGWTGDGYVANVQMYNYQFFRSIPAPGWQLKWNWTNGEVIWSMQGAEATQQGDCAKVTWPGGKVPHCCLQFPTIIDLLPLQASTYKNCCKSGELGAWAQGSTDYLSAFQITVGNATNTIWSFVPPGNMSIIGVDGYTCTDAIPVNATKFYDIDGKRSTQALVTINFVCTYSRVEVKQSPKCCVSLSTFYNESITPCGACSCACGNFSKDSVVCAPAGGPDSRYLMSSPTGKGYELKSNPNAILCSPDGCGINVHWHVKVNYQKYWRAKVTIINRSLQNNYSLWNLAVEHPSLANLTEIFSFHGKTVQPYGVNNTGVFWGLPQYNDILLPAANGTNYVSSEFLFKKTSEFTLSNGWAFPRKIVFNGEECVMPNTFPTLPSPAGRGAIPGLLLLLSCLVLSIILLI